jgi:hypothetical protein
LNRAGTRMVRSHFAGVDGVAVDHILDQHVRVRIARCRNSRRIGRHGFEPAALVTEEIGATRISPHAILGPREIEDAGVAGGINMHPAPPLVPLARQAASAVLGAGRRPELDPE